MIEEEENWPKDLKFNMLLGTILDVCSTNVIQEIVYHYSKLYSVFRKYYEPPSEDLLMEAIKVIKEKRKEREKHD